MVFNIDKRVSTAGIEPATNGLKEVCIYPAYIGSNVRYYNIGWKL
jgi:hypothetical protein